MALRLSEVLNNVHNIDWTHISNFSVDIHPNNFQFRNLINWDIPTMQKKIDISIKNINIPQHSCAMIEEFLGTEWRQANSRDELFTLTMTIRDFNNGELYRRFKQILHQTKGQYFDVVSFSIKVFSDSNTHVDPENGRIELMSTDGALLTSISQVQFSHENGSEIMEFDVEFKFNSPRFSNVFKDNIEGNISQTDDFIKNKLSGSVNRIISNTLDSFLNKFEKSVSGLLDNW